MEYSKPPGAKLRNARALLRGRAYKVKFFYQEKSRFEDKVSKQFPLKTIAVYEDIGFVFYTYLCKDYDDKPIDYVVKLNKAVKEGKDIRIVYYGSMGTYNIVKILEHGEEVNQETLDGLACIEEAEKVQVVLKREAPSEDDGSPSKKPKEN